MTRKFQLLTILWCMLACTMSAQNIDVVQAQKNAEDFLSSRDRHLPLTQAETASMRARTRGENTKDYYYVFNAGDKEGFVIASADDRTPSILAYTLEGSFNLDDMPESVAEWLRCYEDQIAYIQKNNLQRTSTRNAFAYHQAVPNLMKTKWSQRAPYYNDCPKWNDKPCLTGCVSTSMAQVMYYYQHPKGTTVSIPGYYTTLHHLQVPELPATTFDWSKIRVQHVGTTAEENEAVAHLMIYCSTAVKADFTPTNTNAYYREQKKALTEYFGYSNKILFISRANYDDLVWENLIYQEIANQRPVLYSGQVEDKSGSAGHSFVLHGFDGKGYYAVNWGWGGSYDGYYLLDAMSPNSKYNFRQHATIGIVPDTHTSIRQTTQDTPQKKVYDLNGRQISGSVKNKLVIEKETDGTTRKIFTK